MNSMNMINSENLTTYEDIKRSKRFQESLFTPSTSNSDVY